MKKATEKGPGKRITKRFLQLNPLPVLKNLKGKSKISYIVISSAKCANL